MAPTCKATLALPVISNGDFLSVVCLRSLGCYAMQNVSLTKNLKTYIRCKNHQNSTPKRKTIRTTTEVLPWNDQ